MAGELPADKARRDTITRLLEIRDDEPRQAAELLPLLYEELRALARARMAREPVGHTIHATVLVHEAYMRLVGNGDPGWNGRNHFFAAAAIAMRRILVDHARRQKSQKQGGNRDRAEWDEALAIIQPPEQRVLELDEAVQQLESQDARKGQIVNLRHFAGFTMQETADAMQLSLGTIEREWRFIKAWLKDQLEEPPSGSNRS